ncbi:hypothetical protein C8R45DRAFT_173579 [Mycena sanguinolenta]|nr:hypothetical protein C8R45DRAFT_173579 [Mycena sanguinolenta]
MLVRRATPHGVGVLHPHSSSTSGLRCSFAIPPNGSPRRRGTLRRHRSCFRSPRLLIPIPSSPLHAAPGIWTLVFVFDNPALYTRPEAPLWRSSYHSPLYAFVWTWTRPRATAAAFTPSTGLRAHKFKLAFHNQPSERNRAPCSTTDDGRYTRARAPLYLPSMAETLSIAGAVRFSCSKRRDGAFLRLRDHRCVPPGPSSHYIVFSSIDNSLDTSSHELGVRWSTKPDAASARACSARISRCQAVVRLAAFTGWTSFRARSSFSL